MNQLPIHLIETARLKQLAYEQSRREWCARYGLPTGTAGRGGDTQQSPPPTDSTERPE